MKSYYSFYNREYEFNLTLPRPEEAISFDELIERYKTELKNFISNFDIDFKTKILKKTAKEILNLELQLAPGAVITTMSPSGGSLRNKLLEILENNENLDDLLAIDVIKNTKKLSLKNYQMVCVLIK